MPSSLSFFVIALRLFLSEQYKKCLLILDDVWSSDIVRTFNVGGRILLTTQDVSIVECVGSQNKIIPLRHGFALEESLQV